MSSMRGSHEIRTLSAVSVAVDVADGHDTCDTQNAVDQRVEQLRLERMELVGHHECDCADSGDPQEEHQASDDGPCLFITPLLALHEARMPGTEGAASGRSGCRRPRHLRQI